MAVNKKNILTRYFFIVLIFGLTGIAILVKAGLIMFAERGYWQEVADRFVRENVPVKPNRGNIISADGKLLASSLPEYTLYIDFMAGGKEKDSLLRAHMKEICNGLHRIFPDKSAAYFRNHLEKGRRKKARYYRIYPGKVSYIDCKEVQKLPVFSLPKNKGGFIAKPDNQRKKPFGSLASRTLGAMYADLKDSAKSGLELSFDKLLKGKTGHSHRQKIMNRYLNMADKPAEDGCDIITTLDVDMQDICEKALRNKLEELEAESGVAILMEVATGDVKAIVNLDRWSDGMYYEMQNHAISDLLEPGSTFKTASIMVALEDGYITPDTEVDTGNGIMDMYGSKMRDHNWYKGGYGVLDVNHILMYSSNIGVSYLIDKYYKNDPQRFVDGLKRMSLDQQLDLQIPGAAKPNIKGPKERYFAKTSLPWMSIGYETQLPPINILTFYNAIANNGTMVCPRFVTAAVKEDEIIEEYPVQVINPKICSDHTLEQIRTILRKVVKDGLAKPAGSKQFATSGKTGTAQISKGKEGYKSGSVGHLVSFCGYFPSEAPKYSCIVSIKNPKGVASGGLMAGSVFSRIAERVYAKDLRLDYTQAKDSNSILIPDVKPGNLNEAQIVLDELEIAYTKPELAEKRKAWGYAETEQESLLLKERSINNRLVPNVHGMGIKDAVFLLEKEGLNVRITGVGKVRKQSLAPGSVAHKGQTITLILNP